MYYFEAKNKLPHMVLLEIEPSYYYGSANPPKHYERVKWLVTNIGERNKDWCSRKAACINGEKLYWNQRHKNTCGVIDVMLQYSFKSKEDAFKFRIACG